MTLDDKVYRKALARRLQWGSSLLPTVALCKQAQEAGLRVLLIAATPFEAETARFGVWGTAVVKSLSEALDSQDYDVVLFTPAALIA